MKTCTIALAAVLLASGCARTPEAIRDLGVMHTVASPADYEKTAKCSIRRYDEIGHGMGHNLRVYGDEGYAEIVSTGGKPVAYTDFRRADQGSTARIYASDDLVLRGLIARRMAEAVQGCADKFQGGVK